MGKYSNMMKCAQVRSLVNEKQFEKALDIIEEINIEKINTITDLNIIAEVFKKFERYEDAREIYLRLYDRIQTRRVIYQLIYLSVKCNNIDDAEEFYKEYMELDAGSCDSIILRYYIDKAKGADRKILIESLEKLKEEEYIEEWAYELAKLYHKEGMKEECIRECTDIILWFGEGTIVEKATLLKLHYVDGADISSAKAIEETRNIAAELKMAAAIAEQNEKRKEEEEKRRREIFTEIRRKREGKKEQEPEESQSEQQQTEPEEAKQKEVESMEDLGLTRKIDNLQDYIKRTKKRYSDEDKAEVVKEEEVVPNETEKAEETKEEDSLIDEEKYNQSLLEVHKMLDKIREEQDSEDYNPEDYLEDPPEPDEEEEFEDEETMDNSMDLAVSQEEPRIEEVSKKEDEINLEEAMELAKRAKIQKEILENTGRLHNAEIIEQEILEQKKDAEELNKVADEETVKEEFEPIIENAVSKEEQLLIRLIQEAKRKDRMPHFAIIGDSKDKIEKLSKELAKELCRQQLLSTSRIAKISAEKLNRIDLQENRDKVKGGCLLVDNAHELSLDSLQGIYQFLNRNKGELSVMLTDNEENMDWLMVKNRKLRNIIEFDLKV